MGDKDIISKELLKEMAKDISRHILKIEVADDMELIDKEFTRIEKRDADLLFKNGHEIVHIEIQNNYHAKMHLRMLRYLSDILFEYESFTVKQYLLFIGTGKQSMKNTINQYKLDYSYDIIDIRDIPCESFLQSSDPSAVVLAILCDFEGKDKQEVVNTILKKLLELSKDEMSFRSYLKKVEIYSTNRALEDYVEKGEEMLTVDLEKMPSFKKGLQQGVENTLEIVAIGMLKLNVDLDIIQKTTGLTTEEIKTLQQKI